MKKNLILYHSRDLDGWMSAAIGMLYKNTNLDYIGWDYGEPIPSIKGYKNVYMFDISFDEENINNILLHNDYLILIDHHKSSRYLKQGEEIHDNLTVIHDSNYAACELVYNYFYPNSTMLEQVYLLGLYDSYRHIELENQELKDKVIYFQYACRSYFSSPDDCYDLLTNYNHSDVNNLTEKGKAIFQYLKKDTEVAYNNKGQTAFYNDYKLFVINRERLNVKNFGINIKRDGYHGIISYFYNKNRWSFSIYGNGDVDVSEIAKQFGGGGHYGAAGFELYNYNDFFDKCIFEDELEEE